MPGVEGLGHTTCEHLRSASGEEGCGPQVLEAVNLGLDTITGGRVLGIGSGLKFLVSRGTVVHNRNFACLRLG